MAQYGMLSFQINRELSQDLKSLSNRIALTNQFVQDLSQEERESIHQFARVSMVGASTRIENAVLTDTEIQWIDTELTKEARPTSFESKQSLIEDKFSKDRERSIEEVAGCREMLFLIYEQHSDFFPLSESTIRGFHQQLLRYYPPAQHYLGCYKTVTNSVVERNHKTNEERIVFKTADPGPITEVAMNDLVSWYNRVALDQPWSVAIACEFVFRFLAIHPFQDGNGRLGRGLYLLALLQSPNKALSQLARYLAIDRQIERHKAEYYYILQQCSGGVFFEDPQKYKIELFLKYMIKILNHAINGIDLTHQRYMAIQKLSESSLKVLECFKEFPEKRLQTKDIESYTKLPRRTIIYSLNNLVEKNLLQKKGEGAGTRYQIIF